jgi:hypothetical protein
MEKGIQQYTNYTFQYIDIFDDVRAEVAKIGGGNCAFCDGVHPYDNLNARIGDLLSKKISDVNSSFTYTSSVTQQPTSAYWYSPLQRTR